MRGVVKWYSQEKGYGFLRPIEQQATKRRKTKGTKNNPKKKDIFVHVSNIDWDLQEHFTEGYEVEFDVGPGRLYGQEQALDVRFTPQETLRRALEEKEREQKYREQEKQAAERKAKSDAEAYQRADARIAKMAYHKQYIEYDAKQRHSSYVQFIGAGLGGDYLPEWVFHSGHFLRCDLCQGIEKFDGHEFSHPVIKTKKVTKTGLFGLYSYEDTEYTLTDGNRVKIIEKPKNRYSCHKTAKF